MAIIIQLLTNHLKPQIKRQRLTGAPL